MCFKSKSNKIKERKYLINERGIYERKKFMKLLGVIVLCLAMITTTPISVFAEDIVQTDDVQQVQETTQEDINQDESNNNQG